MMLKRDKKTLLITTLICICMMIINGAFCKFYPLTGSPDLEYRFGLPLIVGIVFNVILNIGLSFTVCKKMGGKIFSWIRKMDYAIYSDILITYIHLFQNVSEIIFY